MREKEAQVNHAKRQLQLHRIDVDMERICYYVEQVRTLMEVVYNCSRAGGGIKRGGGGHYSFVCVCRSAVDHATHFETEHRSYS